MLQCILLDSPHTALHVLQNYLDASKNIHICKKFCLPEEAEDYCRNEYAALIICNIELVEKKTVDTIKYHQPNSLIVIAGERDSIENKCIEENIFAYLYKPFSFERIMALLTRANAYLGYSKSEEAETKRHFVFIKSEYKTIRVDLEDILYCEGLKDYTQIYLKGKAKPLITLRNLKSLSEKLPAADFVRVHRSFIVSVEQIEAITRNEIIIGNSEIPIGDAYREKLNDIIGNYS